MIKVVKIKGEWVKQHPLEKYEHFADFSWPWNKGRPWNENLPETYRLIFSLYTGVVASPVMFLLQAFTIMRLSDHNTEQRQLKLPKGASVTVKKLSLWIKVT